MMRSALVGYTGFVGSTLMRQTDFQFLFNSSNIDRIDNQVFDLLICAAAPAEKWRANKNPVEDLQNINKLIKHLSTVHAKTCILISTVDVYQQPEGVDESTPIEADKLPPYGQHRYFIEQFVSYHFSKYHIVRLPGLFGTGLKKNFIFDMIHENTGYTHSDGVFQFYNMNYLWQDIQVALSQNLPIINFATEPIKISEIAYICNYEDSVNITDVKPAYYNMKTLYSNLYNGRDGYIYDKYSVLNDISYFYQNERVRIK